MKIGKTLLALAAIGIWSGAVGASTIDTFEDGDYSVAITAGSGTVANTQPGSTSNIIGGFRTVTASTPAGRLNIDINTAGYNPGHLDIANSSGANGTVTILWDANGAGLGGQDITDGGASTGFLLGFPNPADNGLTFNFLVNGSSAATKTFADGSVGGGFFIPFSTFSDSSVFTSVNSIQLTLSSSLAWDATIDLATSSPTPVPVPAAFWLMGSAMLGLARFSSRGRKA